MVFLDTPFCIDIWNMPVNILRPIINNIMQLEKVTLVKELVETSSENNVKDTGIMV